MSLHQLANHMSAQGRGPDSNLVHMSPRELSGLQSLAMAHGGTLTINPETGLPEAGFLDSILPTLLGGAATFFSGGAITPFMAALGVGGLTALTSKDLGKGLMAGLGAYGGSGIMEGLAGFGAADIGEKAISSAAADATAAGLENTGEMMDAAGNRTRGSDAYAAAVQKGVGDRMAGASYSDKLKAGFSKALSNPGDAFNAIGGGSMFKGAAMIGAPLLSAISSQDATSVPTAEQIRFDPRYPNINISRQQRPYQPDTGSSGERSYFGPTNVTQYGADGGFVSNDEIQHFAYGGGTIDPNYNYSGYGNRNVSSAMQPITSVEAPKPDFVGADGKTYRYDPIKKSWYVIKEAEEKKVNAGVETLMDGAGGGNDAINLNTTPDWGTAFQIGKTLSNMGLTSVGGYLERSATNGILGQSNQAAKEADALPSTTTGLPQGYDTAASRAGRGTSGTGTPTGSSASIDYAGGIPDPGTGLQGQGYFDGQTGLYGDAAAGTGMSTSSAVGTSGGVATGTSGGSPADAGGPADPGGPAGPATGTSGGSPADAGSDNSANGGMVGRYAQGGLGSLGGYSDGGRLLRGPGDGVSDSIPASIGDRQPARLADGEFVVPARIVSELGNGSTEAGARALYKMMDRIQANRRKTTGKNSVAVNSKSHKYLPA